MFKKLLSLLPVLIIAFGMQGGETNLIKKNGRDRCERWADSVYNTLTERQRVAQLVFPKVGPNRGESSKAQIKKLVATNQVGGLLFAEGSLEQ